MTCKRCNGKKVIDVKHSPDPKLIGSVIIQCPDCCCGVTEFGSPDKEHYDIPCDKCKGVGYLNKTPTVKELLKARKDQL